jgi:hypothetical protein
MVGVKNILKLPPGNCGFFAEANQHLARIYRHIRQTRWLEDAKSLIVDTGDTFTRYRDIETTDVYKACFDTHTKPLCRKDIEDITHITTADFPGWGVFYTQTSALNNPRGTTIIPDISSWKDRDIQSRYLKALSPIIRKWFLPSSETETIKNQLISKYHIDLTKTISIFTRGTDKDMESRCEAKRMPTSFCLDSILQCLKTSPELESVLIQSDCQLMTDELSNAISKAKPSLRIIVIDEMYKSSDNQPIHLFHYKRGDVPDKLNQIQTLLAIVNIMKDCKYVIASTSNITRWIWLYRANRERFIQYADGNIV